MQTECNVSRLEFQPLGRREIRAEFDGGRITSDGGGLLLREVELRTGLLQRFGRDGAAPQLGRADGRTHGYAHFLDLVL